MFHIEEVEAFNIKNIEGMTDPDLPPCPRDIDDAVPKCGSSIKDSCLDNFNKEKDNFILKTKVVTPICPNNPYEKAVTDWKKDQNEEVEKEPVQTDNSFNVLPNLNTDFLPNLNMDLSANRLPSLPGVNKEDTNKEDTNKEQVNNQPNFFNSNTMMNNNNVLSNPEKKTEPEPAKEEDKKSEPEDISKCPPCPACERCPEPTVDCKRVVKYKNQSYPVPVIADFSNFSRFS